MEKVTFPFFRALSVIVTVFVWCVVSPNVISSFPDVLEELGAEKEPPFISIVPLGRVLESVVKSVPAFTTTLLFSDIFRIWSVIAPLLSRITSPANVTLLIALRW